MPLGLASTFAWDAVTTPTTALTPADALCRVVKDAGIISYDGAQEERVFLRGPYICPTRAALPTLKRASVAVKSEMKGNVSEYAANVKPDYHELLVAAGFDGVYAAGGNTWTYTRETHPDDHGLVSFRQQWADPAAGANNAYIDAVGCRMDFTVEYVPGNPVYWSWTGRGIQYLSGVAAMVTPTYAADIAPPLCIGVGFDPWSDAPGVETGHIRKITIAARNNLTYAPALTTTYADRVVLITGYGPETAPGSLVTLEVEMPQSTVAAANVWDTRWSAQTLAGGTLTITVGSAAHNSHICTLGGLRVDAPPKYAVTDGMIVATITCRALGTSGGTSNNDVIFSTT